MDRLNTADMPRFVLNVEDAQAWLGDITSSFPENIRDARSPMDAEVSFGPDWSYEALSGPSGSAAREMLANLLTAAQEIGILATPDGVRLEMESGDDGYRFLVTSDDRWGLTLAGNDKFFADGMYEPRGVLAVLAVLMSAVNEGNAMLRSLVLASSSILAQFSTDPLLVTRLADSGDETVRALAVDNPVAPDEAKVLRALREREGER